MGMMGGGGMAGGWSSNLGGGGHGPRSSWTSSADGWDQSMGRSITRSWCGASVATCDRIASA